jgi:hypothetical protein
VGENSLGVGGDNGFCPLVFSALHRFLHPIDLLVGCLCAYCIRPGYLFCVPQREAVYR